MQRSQRVGVGLVMLVLVGALVVVYVCRPNHGVSISKPASLGKEENVAVPPKPAMPAGSPALGLIVPTQPTPVPTAEPARVEQPSLESLAARSQKRKPPKATSPSSQKSSTPMQALSPEESRQPAAENAGALFKEGTEGADTRFKEGTEGAGTRFKEGADGVGARFEKGSSSWY